MKTLKKIKLSTICKNNLGDREMNRLNGGGKCTCGCGCLYEGTGGGSSTRDNGNANKSSGYFSSSVIQVYCGEDWSSFSELVPSWYIWYFQR